MENAEKIIGIVGGVGPEAGTLLHRYIIAETALQKRIQRDQDHLIVQHISASPWISDRTAFLLGQHQDNPANGAFRVIQILENTARDLGQQCVVGVPCNTFHAQPIFGELARLIRESGMEHVSVLNMIEETKKYIEEAFGDISRIGLMSTTGTREQRIYHDILEPLGYEVIEVDTEKQNDLHDTIYNKEWGIKSISPVSEKARENFENFAQEIIKKGAEAIILGCTEIPLALPGENFEETPLIDPMRALARALVKKAIEAEMQSF